ncbi:MAG: hypothetical protein PHF51_03235 [Candidatus ainarchaeum sp.]|nr:hypothetical protein [Candidatus ainarchaeum sp.]
MDGKLFAAAAAVTLIVFVGAAVAASGLANAGGWRAMNRMNRTAPDFNATGNGSTGWFKGRMGMPPGGFNATGEEMGNKSLELAQFIEAVEAGDYAAAKSLHGEHGFGGPVFARLNETTFPKYSEVFRLTSELMGELGLTGEPGVHPYAGGFGSGFGPGFARGFDHRPANCTNSPPAS